MRPSRFRSEWQRLRCAVIIPGVLVAIVEELGILQDRPAHIAEQPHRDVFQGPEVASVQREQPRVEGRVPVGVRHHQGLQPVDQAHHVAREVHGELPLAP